MRRNITRLVLISVALAAVLWGAQIIEGDLTVRGLVTFLTPLDLSSNTDFAVASNGVMSYDGEEIQVNDLFTRECVFTNPVTGHSDVCQLKWPYAVTVTRIHCNTTTATSTMDIEFEERAEATPNTAGTEVMGADLQCSTTGATDTTFDNATIAANVPMSLKITAVANAPTVGRVYVTGRHTP